ncbi:GspH/FimT family pseudopilin [Corallincola platygyrae]|uniref:Type II secretion system protein H n=1 Tax=Corallincola platygyrae TaxID=1193278 RepID=A0ABW4XSI5_9GAMM
MRSKDSGFTLVELMVTLAIAVILATLAAPSFIDSLESSRAKSASNDIHKAFQLARGEAVARKIPTTVCPMETTSCGTDWSKGIAVFQDANGNGAFDNGTDTFLKKVDIFSTQDLIKATGSSVTFSVQGTTTDMLTINYCPGKEATNGRKVVLSMSGRSRVSKEAISCN